ncbi:MAG TPA: DNA repair protein RecN [Thermoanaerobaculia bacterium]|nr:DNA repair protein RecN [Thermoanaerobaculia bacterium]
MLRELHVRNLAVLADVAIDFGPGFNVLSGETGAGKSIVVDSLALLAGGRASDDMIRSGAEVLSVAGVFEPVGEGWREALAAAGIQEDGAGGSPELLVRREIHRNGRNRVYVNDQPATARVLADLAPFLLRIHGQREELGLVTPDLQRAWLDRSGGPEAAALLERVGLAYDRWAGLAERLADLAGDQRAREERLDLLRFQASEIDTAALRAGEDDDLRRERDLLRNAEAITQALGASAETLFEEEGSAVDRLARSEDLLAGIEGWQEEAAAWRAELEEARIRVEEVARSLRRQLDGIEADPRRLDAIEDRLAAVERLAKKYGGGAAAILDRRREIGGEIERLEGAASSREELVAMAAEALEAYREAALELSARRAVWGAELSGRIHEEIADLGLGKARLEVSLRRRRRDRGALAVDGEPVEPTREGIDQVVFLFTPNPGEEPQPLSRIASGGELSRVSLGLQLASRGEREAAPTLIFDEVDVGVGGAQAAALGRKLRRLSASGQILAVTHLPQVASYGHHHLRVTKEVAAGRTTATIEGLLADRRVEEVARMLAGREVTELSLSHARELLEGAAAEEARAAAS